MIFSLQYDKDVLTPCAPDFGEGFERGGTCDYESQRTALRKFAGGHLEILNVGCDIVTVSAGGIMAYGAKTNRTSAFLVTMGDTGTGGALSDAPWAAADVAPGEYVLVSLASNFPLCSRTTPFTVPQESPLAKAIDARLQQATFDDREIGALAIRARDAAVAFVRAHLPFARPMVMVSDEGAVLLQWRRESTGVLVVFNGDKTATYSIKEPGGSYSLGIKDLRLDGPLPTDLAQAIARFDQPAP